MYIFISYSSKNTDEATNACKKLEKAGQKCFLAYRDIAGGSVYAEELVNAIDKSNAMLLLLSEGANESPHVLREVERACSKNIPIIVYKLEDVVLSKSLEYFLMTHQWVTKDDDDERLIGVFGILEKRFRESESSKHEGEKAEDGKTGDGKAESDKTVKENGNVESIKVATKMTSVNKAAGPDAINAGKGKSKQNDDGEDSNALRGKDRFVITKRTLYILTITGILLIAAVVILIIAVSKTGNDESAGVTDSGIVVGEALNAEKSSDTDVMPVDYEGSESGTNDAEVKDAVEKDSEGSGTGTNDAEVKDAVEKDSEGSESGTNDAEVKDAGEKDSDGSESGTNDAEVKDAGEKDSEGSGMGTNDAEVKDAGEKDSEGSGTNAAEVKDAGEKDSGESMPVSELSGKVREMKPGDCITIGSYRDEPIEWVVLHRNDDGSTILISKDILCLKMFDAPESGEYGTCTDEALLNGETALDCTYWTNSKAEKYGAEALIEAYGNNDWSVSNIRCWLNADRNLVHYEDSAPGKVFPGENWSGYSDEKGFLKNFTDEEKSALSEYSYTYVNSITGEKKELHDRVFLLSEKELDWFFSEDISPLAKVFESVLEDDYEKNYENYNNNGYFFWWLRDGSKKAACMNRFVSNSLDELVFEYLSSYYGYGGIRPCICIK